ncbi:hypothetical protein GJ496_006645 [Pomphorhynchus laevis]|nr:hypothetical protein GJ496_006645 [Pomphorhynchus laevis]
MDLSLESQFASQYTICEELGRGQFAKVHRVYRQNSNLKYAAKFIDKLHRLKSGRSIDFDRLSKESSILNCLNHENIVRLHETFDNPRYFILVMEFIDGEELFSYISKRDSLSEKEVSIYVYQILLAAKHMHERWIVHLDLKPENIMIGHDQNNTIKIIDFGIAEFASEDRAVTTIYGTLDFVAPEIIQCKPVSTACDIWSIGVITYILLTGYSPFVGNNDDETQNYIINCTYSLDDELFQDISKIARHFISVLLKRLPNDRCNAEQCLIHEWFQTIIEDNSQPDSKQANFKTFKSFVIRRRWKRSLQIILRCKELIKQSSNSVSHIVGEECPILNPDDCTLQQHITFEVPRKLLKELIVNESITMSDDNVKMSTLLTSSNQKSFTNDGLNKLRNALATGQNDIAMEILNNNDISKGVTKEGFNVLFLGVIFNNINVCKLVINSAVYSFDLNANDSVGRNVLHWACISRNVEISLLIISSGRCHFDKQDDTGNSPLHYASQNNIMQPVVQALCTNGCLLNTVNCDGQTALHIATASGSDEIVRCLCLAGAVTNLTDKNSKTPSMLIETISENKVLSKLFQNIDDHNYNSLIEQLKPLTNCYLHRIKVKIFGEPMSGKTTLIQNLISSTMQAFIHQHMYIPRSKIDGDSGTYHANHILATSNETIDSSSLEEYSSAQRTCRVRIEYPFNFWEYSGADRYQLYYDIFIGDVNCVHAVVVNISKSYEICYINAVKWIDFIKYRLLPQRSRIPSQWNDNQVPGRPVLLLIFTHAFSCSDTVVSSYGLLSNRKAYRIWSILRRKYIDWFDLGQTEEPNIFTIDCNNAKSENSVKSLITKLIQTKFRIYEMLNVCSTVFLNKVVELIDALRRSTPLISCQDFIEVVRHQVNPLANNQHFQELIEHLQFMGEIVFIEGTIDIVCIDPNWLCHTVLVNISDINHSSTTSHYEHLNYAGSDSGSGMYQKDGRVASTVSFQHENRFNSLLRSNSTLIADIFEAVTNVDTLVDCPLILNAANEMNNYYYCLMGEDFFHQCFNRLQVNLNRSVQEKFKQLSRFFHVYTNTYTNSDISVFQFLIQSKYQPGSSANTITDSSTTSIIDEDDDIQRSDLPCSSCCSSFDMLAVDSSSCVFIKLDRSSKRVYFGYESKCDDLALDSDVKVKYQLIMYFYIIGEVYALLKSYCPSMTFEFCLVNVTTDTYYYHCDNNHHCSGIGALNRKDEQAPSTLQLIRATDIYMLLLCLDCDSFYNTETKPIAYNRLLIDLLSSNKIMPFILKGFQLSIECPFTNLLDYLIESRIIHAVKAKVNVCDFFQGSDYHQSLNTQRRFLISIPNCLLPLLSIDSCIAAKFLAMLPWKLNVRKSYNFESNINAGVFNKIDNKKEKRVSPNALRRDRSRRSSSSSFKDLKRRMEASFFSLRRISISDIFDQATEHRHASAFDDDIYNKDTKGDPVERVLQRNNSPDNNEDDDDHYGEDSRHIQSTTTLGDVLRTLHHFQHMDVFKVIAESIPFLMFPTQVLINNLAYGNDNVSESKHVVEQFCESLFHLAQEIRDSKGPKNQNRVD